MEFELIEYNGITEEQYNEYMDEWEQSGEKIVPWASRRNDKTFKELQAYWREEQTEAVYERDLVPATLYFLTDPDGRILGSAHLRHELNDRLMQYGGHIGYGVRPSERRKGFATILLEMMLNRLKEKGYEKILITCDTNNVGSFRVIEKNKGILENVYIKDGIERRRYWINL